jgi:hypothetical protein
VRARRAHFAANRASRPRAQWRSRPVRPAKDQSAGRARQLRVQMLQGDGDPSKALDQGALDGAQPIGATEITVDIGDKAIECLGRASAVAAHKQQPRVALCERRRAGFARLSGWQPVGNWVATAANFPTSLLPVGVTPTTSRRSATRSLRQMATKAQAEQVAGVHVFSSQEGQKSSPAAGRPGGNATGINFFNQEAVAKRINPGPAAGVGSRSRPAVASVHVFSSQERAKPSSAAGWFFLPRARGTCTRSRS